MTLLLKIISPSKSFEIFKLYFLRPSTEKYLFLKYVPYATFPFLLASKLSSSVLFFFLYSATVDSGQDVGMRLKY